MINLLEFIKLDVTSEYLTIPGVLGVLLTISQGICRLSKTWVTALDAPPEPIISALACCLFSKGTRLCSKPATSVLKLLNGYFQIIDQYEEY